ncbi:MAG: right-handed parallel beta-helix repeat-containing protein, partial [Clostridiales bacterium]|nr:right-handed parallel beta-helix repeat-containing protein [Clostridiales bacterium]
DEVAVEATEDSDESAVETADDSDESAVETADDSSDESAAEEESTEPTTEPDSADTSAAEEEPTEAADESAVKVEAAAADVDEDSEGDTAVSATSTTTLSSSDGATQSTVQSALNSASSGDVVTISGTFTFDTYLTLRSGVTLDATNAVITAGSGVSLLLNLYNVSNCTVKGGTWNVGSAQAAKLSGCTNCTLSSMTIKKGNNSDGTVLAYNSTGTVISGCTFTDSGSQSIYATLSDSFVAVGNTISGANGYGIHTYYCDEAVFVGNNISNCCGDGIYASYSNNASISGNTISNITLNDTLDYDSGTGEARSGCGFFLSHCENAKVGVAKTYGGKTYTGNSATNTENYGIAMNLCDTIYIYKMTTNKTGGNSIHISATDRTTVDSCTVTNSSGSGITTTPGTVSSTCVSTVIVGNTVNTCSDYGIWINKSNGSKIVGNTIKATKGDAIHCMNYAANVKISGNKVTSTTGSDGSGIGIYDCTGTTIGSKLTISGKSYQTNTISGVKKYGVNVSRSSNTSVKYCTVNSSSNNAIRVSASKKSTVSNNTVKSSATYGIYIADKSTGTTISNNAVSGSSGAGIYVKSSQATTISSNKVSSSSTYGIHLNSITANCTVKSNTISNSKTPIHVNCSTSQTVTISSNTLTGKTSGYCINVAKGKVSISSNTLTKGKGPICTASGVKGTIGVNTVKSCSNNKYVIKGSKSYTTSAPAKTSALSAKKAASKKMKVSWKKVTNASGYVIQYSTSSSFSNAKTVTVSGGSTVTKTITGLTAGKTYYVRVRAYRTCNNIRVYGSYCAKKSAKV